MASFSSCGPPARFIVVDNANKDRTVAEGCLFANGYSVFLKPGDGGTVCPNPIVLSKQLAKFDVYWLDRNVAGSFDIVLQPCMDCGWARHSGCQCCIHRIRLAPAPIDWLVNQEVAQVVVSDRHVVDKAALAIAAELELEGLDG